MRWDSTGWFVMLIGLGYPAAAVAAPPVEVEVVVNGETEESSPKDFFEAASEDDTSSKSASSAEGTANTQTQVVHIHIGDRETEAEPPEVEPAEPMPEETEEDCAGSCVFAGREDRWEDAAPREGSILLTAHFGTAKGLGIEGYVTDLVGLHLDVSFSGLDLDDEETVPGALIEKNNFHLPGVRNEELTGGLFYWVDMGSRFHLLERSPLDFHLGVGLSWFGYHLDGNGRSDLAGGSLLGRLSTGLRWHWHRLSVGVEAGWYPVELGRLAVEPTPSGNRYTFDIVDYEERFKLDRFSVAWRVGFQF